MSLWIITAHVNDVRNAELLRSAISSIRCYHPGEDITIVDNDSSYNIHKIVASEMYDNLKIITKRPSMAFITSLMVADTIYKSNIDRIVFLMHSTHICRPIPAPDKNCDATSLFGFLPIMSNVWGKLKHFLTPEFVWISNTFLSMGAPLCAAHNNTNCLNWGSAYHSVVSFTPRAWNLITNKYRIWPRYVGDVTNMKYLPTIRGIQKRCKDVSCNYFHPIMNNSNRIVSLKSVGVGMERVFGIYLAISNQHNKKSWDFCHLGKNNMYQNDYVYKTHGHSFRV